MLFLFLFNMYLWNSSAEEKLTGFVFLIWTSKISKGANLFFQIWDTLKGQLQTDFADITLTDDTGLSTNSESGHLSLDYRCMKWMSLEQKVNIPSKLAYEGLYSLCIVTVIFVLWTGFWDLTFLQIAEEKKSRTFIIGVRDRWWWCIGTRCCYWSVEVESFWLPSWVSSLFFLFFFFLGGNMRP